jgi:hypothetical protein
MSGIDFAMEDPYHKAVDLGTGIANTAKSVYQGAGNLVGAGMNLTNKAVF